MNALVAALVLLTAGEPAARPETPAQIAVRLASRQFPRAKWRLAELRSADFTYDGTPDLALLGTDGQALVLAVVEGPVTGRSRVLSLRFPAGAAGAGAICGDPAAAQANTEPPAARCAPGQADCGQVQQLVAEGADAGGLGLVLIHFRETGYCQGIHVHYDGSKLSWWQEAE